MSHEEALDWTESQYTHSPSDAASKPTPRRSALRAN
jgi:hypothetical protein